MGNVQWITVILAVIIIIICIKRIRKTPSSKYIIFPVIFLMVHSLLFYTFVFLKDAGIYTRFTDFSEWSSILRFNSLLTFFLVTWYELRRENGR